MHSFCNYVYAWLVERVKPEDRERFEYELNLPLDPKKEVPVDENTLQSEQDAFFAVAGLAAQVGG